MRGISDFDCGTLPVAVVAHVSLFPSAGLLTLQPLTQAQRQQLNEGSLLMPQAFA